MQKGKNLKGVILMAIKSLTAKNSELNLYLNNMSNFLNRSDIVGYICARNSRVILDALVEYQDVQHKLINELGKEIFDDEGKPTGQMGINVSDKENFEKFLSGIKPYADIEQKVDILTLNYDEVQGILTGSEILLLDFMCID